MTLEESVLATRRQLLRAAEQSGNVSATCRLFNVSRAQFYEWRAAWRQYGRRALLGAGAQCQEATVQHLECRGNIETDAGVADGVEKMGEPRVVRDRHIPVAGDSG